MSQEAIIISIILAIGSLVLVTRGLNSRNMPAGFALRSVLIWVVIGAVLFALLSYRFEIGDALGIQVTQ